MERVLPGADMRGWERCPPKVPTLPDSDDRHVVAAVLAAGPRTRDLRGSAGTREVTDAIVAALPA
jgi:hypothetical protein